MKTTHHSEYLKLSSVFIKPVENAFVSNEVINDQWFNLNYLSKPDFELAIKEYEVLEIV